MVEARPYAFAEFLRFVVEGQVADLAEDDPTVAAGGKDWSDCGGGDVAGDGVGGWGCGCVE